MEEGQCNVQEDATQEKENEKRQRKVINKSMIEDVWKRNKNKEFRSNMNKKNLRSKRMRKSTKYAKRKENWKTFK